jgi:hypothetical protein
MQIGPKLKVPANSSRLFTDREESLRTPISYVQLFSNPDLPYLYNGSFDSGLINYDLNYCTADEFHFNETKKYFKKLLPKVIEFESFIEIGCGQGEFVKYLNDLGFKSFGFDPVIRQPNNLLVRSLWSPDNENEYLSKRDTHKPLYIMRCVLPHISIPFDFLDSLFENNEQAGVLIEFQRREWIEEKNMWPQISHDHVNIFSTEDFLNRYQILERGDFSNSEWAYVLLKKGGSELTLCNQELITCTFENVFKSRNSELSTLREMGREVVIYGSAGKGIVFGFTLIQEGIDCSYALDANPDKVGLYMEGSGIQILSNEKLGELSRKSLIVVMNPNHFSYANEKYSESFEVKSIGNIH